MLTALCLAAGCDNSLSEDFGEPGNETLRELEDKCGLPDPLPGLAPPPGTYADQALVIDYARIKSDEPY